MKRYMIALLGAAFVSLSYAADSPHFRGPRGDGNFPDTGLLKQWPESGPKLVWSQQGLGAGYSSAVVAEGVVYVTGMDEQKQGFLYAFDEVKGALRWKCHYGAEMDKRGPAPAGTRGTPTVDGNRIYLTSSFAKLITVDVHQGRVLNRIDLLQRFNAEQAQFGYAEAVLVVGEKLICAPGGPDAALVALDKKTGATLWQTKGLGKASAYCSARLIKHRGQSIVVTMLKETLVGIDAETGQVLWQRACPHRFGVQPNPPLYRDGRLYTSSGMKAGGVMVTLTPDGQNVSPAWTDTTLDCQMHGVVLVGGCIYGTAQASMKGLVCLDWQSGQVLWSNKDIKRGVVVTADNMLYVYDEDGGVTLVQPSRDNYQPVSSFKITTGTGEHWAHPTIANGRLYIRHGDVLLAYDIKG